jgi:hypothetical protein
VFVIIDAFCRLQLMKNIGISGKYFSIGILNPPTPFFKGGFYLSFFKGGMIRCFFQGGLSNNEKISSHNDIVTKKTLILLI